LKTTVVGATIFENGLKPSALRDSILKVYVNPGFRPVVTLNYLEVTPDLRTLKLTIFEALSYVIL
jgi:hypothetical protein